MLLGLGLVHRHLDIVFEQTPSWFPFPLFTYQKVKYLRTIILVKILKRAYTHLFFMGFLFFNFWARSAGLVSKKMHCKMVPSYFIVSDDRKYLTNRNYRIVVSCVVDVSLEIWSHQCFMFKSVEQISTNFGVFFTAR